MSGTAPAARPRHARRTAAAIALGLALGSLPFVYYRFGVGRHHARHAEPDAHRAGPDARGAAHAARPAVRESEGVDHASHAR